jgi:hypothetical protein
MKNQQKQNYSPSNDRVEFCDTLVKEKGKKGAIEFLSDQIRRVSQEIDHMFRIHDPEELSKKRREIRRFEDCKNILLHTT